MEPHSPLSLRQRLLGKSKARAPSGDSGSVKTRNEKFRLIQLAPKTDVPSSTLAEDHGSASGGQRHEVDIIAVHGLGGDPYKTWTHEDGTLWLRDIAPMQLPGSRIYTFGYDSAFAFSQGTGTVRDFARCLLEALRLERTSQEVFSPSVSLPCFCDSLGWRNSCSIILIGCKSISVKFITISNLLLAKNKNIC